jgi:hypothetical protein
MRYWWAHGPITRENHERWQRHPKSFWFWCVLEVRL